MGGNPVDNKAVDILAAAAGVPAPPKAGGLWAKVWHYRKLALILGGSGLTLGGGGYGYKYFTPNPGKANAQPDAAAMASAPTPEPAKAETQKSVPSSLLDKAPIALPPVKPVKSDLPDVPEAGPFAVKAPADTERPAKPTTFGSDHTDTAPGIAPVLPPTTGDDGKKPTRTTTTDDGPGLPPIDFRIPLPPGDDGKKPTDKARPATESSDTFRASGPLSAMRDKSEARTGPSPRALPTDVTEKKPGGKDGPVLRIGAADPVPPAPPVVDVPPVVAPPAAGPKKEPPELPDIPTLNPVIPMPVKPGEPGVVPPTEPGKGDPAIVSPPGTAIPMGDKPAAKTPEVPTIKMQDIKLPDGPPAPPLPGDAPGTKTPARPVGTDPLPPIGPAPTAPARKTDYEEDWHTWKDGVDTYTLISQEYYHDGRYAKALETYAREHKKPGDKFIRVPEVWRLQELYPHLIAADDKDKGDKPDRPERTEVRPAARPAGPIQFEPAAPVPSAGRPAPPPAAPTPPTDEYRVTGEETLRQVAQKALGDGNAWRKLAELNPGIDPTQIPAGTVLKLPK